MDCEAHVFLYKEKAGPVIMITIEFIFFFNFKHIDI